MTISWPRPTNLAADQAGHIDEHNTINTILNEMRAATRDTGLRNVLSSNVGTHFEGASSLPYLRVRRVGGLVEIAGRIKAKSSLAGTPMGSMVTVATIPAGFIPQNNFAGYGVARVDGQRADLVVHEDTNILSITNGPAINWATGYLVSFCVQWFTGSTFPDPLPGTAVS